jgi:thioredoxin-dependent peroxiredoxin
MPAVGKKIGAFAAPATTDSEVSARSLLGKPYVIYFYPKDDTPGCTTEGEEFRDLYAKFERLGVGVWGVSRDSLASHEKFKAKYGFPFELISDQSETLCKTFDVIMMKNMYGKKVRGIERSTFLIDAKGVLRQEWRKVKVQGHAAEVLKAAQLLMKP